MKIIISRKVALESHLVGQQVAARFGTHIPDISLDEQVEAAQDATAPLRHVSIYRDNEDIVYEISDSLLIMVLRWYSRVAGHVGALIDIAAPLFKSAQQEFAEICEIAAEQK